MNAQSAVTVKLIHATKVPGRHARLVRGSVAGHHPKTLALFEPSQELLSPEGTPLIEEGIVQANEDGCVMLVVQNQSPDPLQLKDGQVLGALRATELAALREITSEESKVSTSQALIAQKEGPHVDSGRQARLLETLNTAQLELSEGEMGQLKQLVTEYENIFAMDNSELGVATGVAHSINTGEQPPTRQPPRRIPFVLRTRVEEIVKDMLDQGVVQSSTSPWASPVVLVPKKEG